MRVLMLTPGLPGPTGSGAAIRNWYILTYLVEQLGASVELMTFAEPDSPIGREALPAAVTLTVMPPPSRDWRRRLRVLALAGRPDLADRLWTPEAQAQLGWRLLDGQIDLLHIGGLELGRYLFELTAELSPRRWPAVVVDEYNAEYVLQWRAWATDCRRPARWPQALYSAVQWWRLRAFERAVGRAADGLVCVSVEDAAALRRLDPTLTPTIIANGVDTVRYAPIRPTTPGLPRFDLLFSGTLDYRPNIDAACWLVEAVWPALWAARPGLTLGLVGQRPAPAVRALAERPGVIVTGPVADDRPYLWGAGIYVVPMRYGGGIRLKLLNALAAGCAVISTTMGAEGVPVVHGRDLLLADRPEQWLRAIDRLLDEPSLRVQLSAGGQALVRQQFDWQQLVGGLAPVYQQALARRRAASVA